MRLKGAADLAWLTPTAGRDTRHSCGRPAEYNCEVVIRKMNESSVVGTTGCVSTSLVQREKLFLILYKTAQAQLGMDGDHLWTLVFRFCHKFSVSFRSRLWLDHSGTFQTLYLWQDISPNFSFQSCLSTASICQIHQLQDSIFGAEIGSGICLWVWTNNKRLYHSYWFNFSFTQCVQEPSQVKEISGPVSDLLADVHIAENKKLFSCLVWCCGAHRWV